MDPIVILLASQLIIIVAILLTTATYKKTEGTTSIKTRFVTYLAIALDLQKEEEPIEVDEYKIQNHEIVPLKTQELVVLERENEDENKLDESKSVIVNKAKRKKKQNSKINGSQVQENLTSSDDSIFSQTKLIKVYEEVNKALKRLLSLNFYKTILKFVVKRIYKATSGTKLSLEVDSALSIPSKLQHGKLIESNYLTKIISARKSEKAIRVKIIRLNMLIVKARKVKPLQVIPELIEHDE